MSESDNMTIEEINDATFRSMMKTNDALMKGLDTVKRKNTTLINLVRELIPRASRSAYYSAELDARARAVLRQEEVANE